MTEWFNFSSQLCSDKVFAVLSQKNSKHNGTSLAKHRSHLARELGLINSKIAVPQQVHGNRIEVALPGQVHLDTDGLVTNDPEIVLSLQVADCSPVFLYHEPSGTRGLVHVGWRGMAAGIVSQATKIIKSMHLDVKEMKVVIGPTIEKECYEVGKEVALQFSPRVHFSNANGRYMLDLIAALKGQLIEDGFPERSIYQADICTRCEPRCHSYRREGKQAGRMIAFFSDRSQLTH